MQVAAPEVEAKLAAEGREEAHDVVVRLRQGVGCEADHAVAQATQGLVAAVVLAGNRAAEGRTLHDRVSQEVAAVATCSKRVVDALVPSAQAGARQHAIAKAQIPKVVADLAEVRVVELASKRCEEAREPLGFERVGVLLGELVQAFEDPNEGFELLDRRVQQWLAVVGVDSEAPPALLLLGDRRACELVELLDDGSVRKAVEVDRLSIVDLLRRLEAREEGGARRLPDDLVAARHCLP